MQILYTCEHLVEIESCHWLGEPIVVEVFHNFEHVQILAIIEHQVIDESLVPTNDLLFII